MLDYLEQLIKEQKWEEVLHVAEQLVQKSDNTVEDMVRISLALIIARAMIRENSGVVTLADHALEMAVDVGDWDAYLTICHFVAFAHLSLNQVDRAKYYWISYIENKDKYVGYHLYEIVTWFNLGVTVAQLGDDAGAVYYYEQARKVTLARGMDRHLLGINHALINAYTRLKQYDKVPRLLAQTLHYLRHNQLDDRFDPAKFFHFKVRAEFALATRRFRRARLVAERCLDMKDISQEHQYLVHMILAKISRETHEFDCMVRHLTSARIAAIRARRYDYELIAAEDLYDFIQSHPSSLEIGAESLPDTLPPSWFEMDGF